MLTLSSLSWKLYFSDATIACELVILFCAVITAHELVCICVLPPLSFQLKPVFSVCTILNKLGILSMPPFAFDQQAACFCNVMSSCATRCLLASSS